MLVKLTPVVDFTNILPATFSLIFLSSNYKTQIVNTQNLLKTLSFQKAACKINVAQIDT